MTNRLLIILLCNIVVFELNSTSLFEEQNTIPIAKEVFSLSSNIEMNAALVSWQIRDGYYMYLDSIEFKYKDELIPFRILESKKELYKDEFFGETEILRDKFVISINVNPSLNLSEVFIYYQGCSEAGFCYPMQKNKIL